MMHIAVNIVNRCDRCATLTTIRRCVMTSDPELTAADIARIAGVGRAAVSNWRRRHLDFPQPVGGSQTSPTFSLTEIKAWLRSQGKPSGDATDRLAGEIGARRGDDAFALLTAVARDVRDPSASSGLDPALRDTLRTASQEIGGANLLDDLLERISATAGRAQHATPGGLARLLVDLVEPTGATVLDPACGVGTVLAAATRAGAEQISGQEINPVVAACAAARLALISDQATI